MTAPRVAVLGASGIGRFHVRELHRAGAEVVAILGSSAASTRVTAEVLASEYGVEARPYHDFERLLDVEVPDAVCICTPDEHHRAQVELALEAGLLVFCEKPLFWHDGLTPAATERYLERFRALGAQERLSLNVANETLLDAFPLPERPASFAFRFRTQGPHQGLRIGVDLLPHALSLLLRLVPEGELEGVRVDVSDRIFSTRFCFGGVACDFLLAEDPAGPKELSFAVDGVRARRVALTDGPYRVALQFPLEGIQREVPDPFAVLLGNFTRAVAGREPLRVSFERAASIQRLVTELVHRAG